MKLRYLLLLFAILAAPWVINFSKFLGCDFESDYRCEVIHGNYLSSVSGFFSFNPHFIVRAPQEAGKKL